MFVCKNLSIVRNGKQMISDVSFEIADGQLLVITGPNGIGKSTLLWGVAGVGTKDETEKDGLDGHEKHGLMHVRGEIFDTQGSLNGLTADERFRRGVMLTFQEPPVLAGVSFLTVAREMLFAKTGVRPEIALLYAQMREAFDRVGLAESFIEKSLFDGFSGGEKKRAELALVLLARPRILLLDEIDAGLDASGRDVARGILRELLAEGTSIICVTHNPDFLADFSDKKTYSLISRGIKNDV